MADFEQKDNTWSLFKNEKRTKETSPDYTGNIVVNGVKMRLSAWIKEMKTGKKYFSGMVSPMKEAATTVIDEVADNEAPF